MFATSTQIDPALALAMGDAAACDWQEPPFEAVCGRRAVWIGTAPCGCRYLCCGPHKAAAEREFKNARTVVVTSLMLGRHPLPICVTCRKPIPQLTITWEPI